jgi:hypothetical protein
MIRYESVHLPTLLLTVVLCLSRGAQETSQRSAKVGQERQPVTGSRLEFSPGEKLLDSKAVIDDMRPIYLVNMFPDVVIIATKVNDGPWQPVGPIRQTCNLQDEKVCAAGELWQQAGFIPCGKPVIFDSMGQDAGIWKGHAETWDCKWISVWYVLHRK